MKIVYNILAVLILFLIGLFFYVEFISVKPASYYYKIIENQEKVIEIADIRTDEINALEECKKPNNDKKRVSGDDCFRSFYDKYTMNNGISKAFQHLAYVQKTFPELLSGCHYLSHGIGHAALRLNKNNIGVAFNILQDKGYFKNVATCGNGYFHGIIEEFSKNTFDKNVLAKLLKPVCESKEIKSKSPCYHGAGHAATVQMDYDLDNSLYVCDNITTDEQWLFSCRTGVFMEIINKTVVNVKKGKMQFNMCEKVDDKYKTACYMEQTSLFEWYSKDPKNYTRNISFCKQIEDPVLRMSCIKLNAIRATRIVHYEKIKEMCNNTSSQAETNVCFAVFSARIAGSMNLKYKSPEYKKVVADICSIAGPWDKYACMYFVYNKDNKLFWTTAEDLLMPKPSWQFIWDNSPYNMKLDYLKKISTTFK